MKNESKILLPLKAAARVLGVKPESLRSEADASRVPFTKVGDEYLFALEALEKTLLARARGKAVARDR
jgi:hypothetical protein